MLRQIRGRVLWLPVFMLAMVCMAAPVLAQTSDAVAAAQLQKLLDGNRRYVKNHARRPNQRPTAGTQKPLAAILSCSDARVPPEILFDQGVNELFVVRVAGNTADDPTSKNPAVTNSVQLQSLAYAVQALDVKLIVVLGHDQCGAVKGALQKCGQPDIGPMFQNICPALHEVPDHNLKAAINANVKEQVKVLKSTPPFADMVKAGKLSIVGGFYDLATGAVSIVVP